jgi:hypothetical protein
MRKPKDFDSELNALDERAKQLRARKIHQLGELVVATGADALPVDILTGALLSAAEAADANVKEGWRTRGTAFFQRPSRKSPATPGINTEGSLPLGSGSAPA